MLLSAVEFRAHMDRKDTRPERSAGELTPGVSVVVPAYNEEALIVPSVQALLALRYPQHEVVVVNDGSTDDTLRVLTEAFDLVAVPSHHPGEIPIRVPVGEVMVPRNGRTRLLVVSKTQLGPLRDDQRRHQHGPRGAGRRSSTPTRSSSPTRSCG